MAGHDWDAVYQQGDAPWDTGAPDPYLAAILREGRLPAGRALEIGCGTGTNARFLARAGYSVVAVDFAPTALTAARERLQGEDVRFEQLDIQQQDPPPGPYDLVFDRGCFHVFDAAAERETFARRVAAVLRPGGLWLSLVGSTEGAPREEGPPRRSARDIVLAAEPWLELVELQDIPSPEGGPRFWLALWRGREQPAQPSTNRG